MFIQFRVRHTSQNFVFMFFIPNKKDDAKEGISPKLSLSRLVHLCQLKMKESKFGR